MAIDLSALGGSHDAVAQLQERGALCFADGSVWRRLAAREYAAEYVRMHDLQTKLTEVLDEIIATTDPETCARITDDPIRRFAISLLDRLCPAPAKPPQRESDPNLLSQCAYRLGILRHPPPAFEFFNPVAPEKLPVVVKEVKLPYADETHECAYEPLTKCVFVSQMSNSVLVRIPVGPDGLVIDDQDAWHVGPRDPRSGKGIGGLHNVSLSHRHPGCLWLSLQYANLLLLVDAATLAVRRVMQVPTLLRAADGAHASVRIGGPHGLCECPVTGDVWVGLKGAIGCHPGVTETTTNATGARRLRAAMRRACCDPGTLAAYMALLDGHGYDSPPPEGFAVWRCAPDQYDPRAADGAKGGILYACRPSPPMMCTDGGGHCWVTQDCVDTVLRIDAHTGACEQLSVPFPPVCHKRLTGPAIVRAPDDALWITLLGGHASLVRIDPHTRQRVLYCVNDPQSSLELNLIHLAFHVPLAGAARGPTHNTLYALSSDLLNDRGTDALIVYRFSADWRSIVSHRVVPLPTQDCACHRVRVVQPDPTDERLSSVVITEMTTSKLLQLQTANLAHFVPLAEAIARDGEGFEVRTYTPVEGARETEHHITSDAMALYTT